MKMTAIQMSVRFLHHRYVCVCMYMCLPSTHSGSDFESEMDSDSEAHSDSESESELITISSLLSGGILEMLDIDIDVEPELQ